MLALRGKELNKNTANFKTITSRKSAGSIGKPKLTSHNLTLAMIAPALGDKAEN